MDDKQFSSYPIAWYLMLNAYHKISIMENLAFQPIYNNVIIHEIR